MDDRDLEALGEIARVERRAGIADVGGEADLVVDDDVDGAASGVAGESGEVERLGDDALPGERRVAVEQDRQRAVAILRRRPGLAALVLGGARHPLHDRVDELEMTRVRGQRRAAPRPSRHPRSCARRAPRWYFTSPVTPSSLEESEGAGARAPAPFEGGDDRGVGLAEDVGQDIETAAVGHAEHDLAHAVGGGIVDDRVEHRHQGVGALDREALLTEIGLVQEALEALDLGQPLEQLLLRLRRRGSRCSSRSRPPHAARRVPRRSGPDRSHNRCRRCRCGADRRSPPWHWSHRTRPARAPIRPAAPRAGRR